MSLKNNISLIWYLVPLILGGIFAVAFVSVFEYGWLAVPGFMWFLGMFLVVGRMSLRVAMRFFPRYKNLNAFTFALVSAFWPLVAIMAWFSNLWWDRFVGVEWLMQMVRVGKEIWVLLPEKSLLGLSVLLTAIGWCGWFYVWGRKVDGTSRTTKYTHATRFKWGFLLLSGLAMMYFLPELHRAGEPVTNTLHPRAYPPIHPTAELAKTAFLQMQDRESYQTGTVSQQRPVMLILVDGLRADRMSLYGYERPTTPFLDSLNKSGNLTQVTSAVSTCSESWCGVMSILNSSPLNGLGLYNFSLPEVLKQAGYQTHFFLSGDYRGWYQLNHSFRKKIDVFTDGNTPGEYPMFDDRQLPVDMVQLGKTADIPGFYFFHLMSAHCNGVKLPKLRPWQPSEDGLDCPRVEAGLYDSLSLSNTYDNGVLQTDHIIRSLFEVFKEFQMLDDALIVITSDHGEALGEHNHWGHVYKLYQEDISIPLLIYDPLKGNYQNTFYATHLDIAPTVVDRLGLPVPEIWPGESLLKPFHSRETRHQTREEKPCFATIYRDDSTWTKRIFCTEDSVGEMYDLLTDPGEKVDRSQRD